MTDLPLYMHKYPIYIISKGRAKSRLTVKSLNLMKGARYRVVIEPQEYDEYAKVIDKDKLLVLPFSNLGQGSIPARNWVWQHATKEGHARHWIIDDNIRAFYRLHNNLRVKIVTAAGFRALEDYTDRYSNVPMSGMNYYTFVHRREYNPPYYLNTRVYSIILLENSASGAKWGRGGNWGNQTDVSDYVVKFNEDTILSLDYLKEGYCTFLFNSFIGDKVGTQIMKGGNTEELYEQQTNKRLEFVEQLIDQHPDVTKLVWRHNRWHHEVKYHHFRQKPILKPGNEISKGYNEYNMKLVKITQAEYEKEKQRREEK